MIGCTGRTAFRALGEAAFDDTTRQNEERDEMGGPDACRASLVYDGYRFSGCGRG